MIILGIDCSTAVVGIAVYDSLKQKILHSEAIILNKQNKGSYIYSDLYEKAAAVHSKLRELRSKKRYGIDAIAIEEPLQMFLGGKSSAATISTLQRFNGMVSLLCYEVFDIKPQHISASTARKACGIKIVKGGDTKKTIWQHWIAKGLLEEKLNKNGNMLSGEGDIADAITIAIAGAAKEK